VGTPDKRWRLSALLGIPSLAVRVIERQGASTVRTPY
jgi:hypothetical protein